MNPQETVQPELVRQLQTMVQQALAPSQMLQFLQAQVDNECLFTAYMQAACLDDDCDAGLIWVVASRWWTHNQTPAGADRLLHPIYEQSRIRWQQRLEDCHESLGSNES